MIKQYKNPKGFTLIELLVAIAIFSIVVSGIVTAKIRQQDQHVSQMQAAEMQQSVRAVMMMMKDELRMAGFNDLQQNYGEGISVANPTSVTFSSVADSDGNLDVITYAYDNVNKDITVDTGGGPQVLAENIQNLNFLYFDSNGNDSSASPNTTQTIRISITATTDDNELARSAGNNTRTLTSTVFLRNLTL